MSIKINDVAIASIAKINGTPIQKVAKINGVKITHIWRGNSNSVDSGTSLVTSLTVPLTIEDYPNRLLLVAVSHREGLTDYSSGATWNGNAMTLLRRGTKNSSNVLLEVFYMVAPASGSYNAVVDTGAATGARAAAGAVVFYGVNQTTPYQNDAIYSGSATSHSANVTVATDGMPVDFIANRTSESLFPYTDGRSTSIITDMSQDSTPTNNAVIGASIEKETGSVAMGWVFGSASRQYHHILMGLNPA